MANQAAPRPRQVRPQPPQFRALPQIEEQDLRTRPQQQTTPTRAESRLLAPFSFAKDVEPRRSSAIKLSQHADLASKQVSHALVSTQLLAAK